MPRTTPVPERTVTGAVVAVTLALLLGACTVSGSPSAAPSSAVVTTTPPTTPGTEAPPATVDAGRAARYDARSGAPTGGAAGAPAGPSFRSGAYWASDGRHYFQENGRWYWDLSLAADRDTAGNVVPALYGVYTTAGRELYQFATDIRGYTAFRDLTNALFQYVRWAAWPQGTAATNQNLRFQLDDSAFGQTIWFTAAQLTALLRDGTGGQYGLPATGGMTGVDSAQGLAAGYLGLLAGSLAGVWTQPNCEIDVCVTATR